MSNLTILKDQENQLLGIQNSYLFSLKIEKIVASCCHYRSIIYRYISPDGRSYVGQTSSEQERKRQFLNLNCVYAGKKLEEARRKFGPEAFTYEVLQRIEADSQDELCRLTNLAEQKFIELYDSYNNGLNSTKGGGHWGRLRVATEIMMLSYIKFDNNKTRTTLYKISKFEMKHGFNFHSWGFHVSDKNEESFIKYLTDKEIILDSEDFEFDSKEEQEKFLSTHKEFYSLSELFVMVSIHEENWKKINQINPLINIERTYSYYGGTRCVQITKNNGEINIDIYSSIASMYREHKGDAEYSYQMIYKRTIEGTEGYMLYEDWKKKSLSLLFH